MISFALSFFVIYVDPFYFNVRPYEGIYFNMFLYIFYGEMATIIKLLLY